MFRKKSKTRPFLKLKENINSIEFLGDERNVKVVKNAFSNMLVNVDYFFLQNDFYSLINYNTYVDKIIKKTDKLQVIVEEKENMLENSAGTHSGLGNERKICIGKEYVEKNVGLEKILCHEFIHDITIGMEQKFFSRNGIATDYNSSKCEFSFLDEKKLVHEKIDSINSIFKFSDFFIEGFTEYLAQQICVSKDFCVYTPQVSMVKYANKIMGEKNNINAFLLGLMPEFVKLFGRTEWKSFQDELDAFQNEYAKFRVDYKVDDKFLNIQEKFAQSCLEKLKKHAKENTAFECVKKLFDIVFDKPVEVADDLIEDMNIIENYVHARILDEEQRQIFTGRMANLFCDMMQNGLVSFSDYDVSPDISFMEKDKSFQIIIGEMVLDFENDFPKQKDFYKTFCGSENLEEIDLDGGEKTNVVQIVKKDDCYKIGLHRVDGYECALKLILDKKDADHLILENPLTNQKADFYLSDFKTTRELKFRFIKKELETLEEDLQKQEKKEEFMQNYVKNIMKSATQTNSHRESKKANKIFDNKTIVAMEAEKTK